MNIYEDRMNFLVDTLINMTQKQFDDEILDQKAEEKKLRKKDSSDSIKFNKRTSIE